MTSVALPMSSGGHCFNEKENLMPPAKGDSKEMDEGFAPSEFDVLVGWARQNFHHGTLALRNFPFVGDQDEAEE